VMGRKFRHFSHNMRRHERVLNAMSSAISPIAHEKCAPTGRSGEKCAKGRMFPGSLGPHRG
jgi:hypothetical protein